MVIVKSTKDGIQSFLVLRLTEFFILTEKFSQYKNSVKITNQKRLNPVFGALIYHHRTSTGINYWFMFIPLFIRKRFSCRTWNISFKEKSEAFSHFCFEVWLNFYIDWISILMKTRRPKKSESQGVLEAQCSESDDNVDVGLIEVINDVDDLDFAFNKKI